MNNPAGSKYTYGTHYSAGKTPSCKYTPAISHSLTSSPQSKTPVFRDLPPHRQVMNVEEGRLEPQDPGALSPEVHDPYRDPEVKESP